MHKKFLIVIFAIIIILIWFSFFNQPNKEADNQKEVVAESVDKIIIAHFHGTNQCFSCIKVGEYALKTIEDEFKEEYQKGLIVFMDINGDLEENQEIVEKYRARGSSLFINTISNGIDHIKENTTVWRLVNNENSFKKYFTEALNTILDK